MPNELQTARYDGLIRRVAGLLGGGSKVTESLSELFPMIDVENLPAELLFLAGWNIGFSTQAVAATVGETSRFQLFNQAGTGRIVVVTDVWLDGSAGTVAYTVSATQFAGSFFSGLLRDTRGGAPLSTGAQVGNASTGNTTQFGRLVLEAGVTFHHHAENAIAVLAPGTGLEYGTVADNVALNGTIFWRERQALSSELNFP